MILLTEITSKFSKSKCTYADKISALTIANKVARILVLLQEQKLYNINSIIFIFADQKYNQQPLEKITKEYHLDPRFYDKNNLKYGLEIYDTFPDRDELARIDRDSIGKIERLINRVEFVSSVSELAKNKKYICYLPMIENIHDSVIKLPHVDLIEDMEKSKVWPTKEIFIFKKQKYLEIKEYLSKNCGYKIGVPSIEECEYEHLPFLSHLDHDFIEELDSITKDESRRNKAYFHGKDYLVAKRAIEYYLFEDFETYNLINGVQSNYPISKAYMFRNIHILNESLLNLFSKNVAPIENSGASIALQGLKIDIKDYLSNYREIAIPNSEKIKQVLTKLFISLLIEEEILKGDNRKLYKTIMKNGFQLLLSNVEYINDLHEVISRMNRQSLSVDTLLNCSSFWLRLHAEIEKRNSERNEDEGNFKHRKELLISQSGPIDIWEFKCSGKNWAVIKNGDEIFNDINNYITYLVMIIQYHRYLKKAMPAAILRRSVMKFQSENYKSKIEDPPGDWTNRKYELRLRHKEFKQMVDNYIERSKDPVTMKDHPSIKFYVETENKKIDENFFNDLSDETEAYK